MTLPDNIDIKDKYYVGYFKNEKLIAVLDLIDGYPKKCGKRRKNFSFHNALGISAFITR